jgi:hypothetical protein
MRTDREDNPLALDHPDEVRRLREALDRAGYAPGPLGELLNAKPEELASFRAANRNTAVLARRTEGDAPLATFARLFLLGLPVSREAARRALAPSDPEHWIQAGLLEPRGDGVVGTLQLAAFERLILATDSLWKPEPHPKHVLGVGSPTYFLSQFTVRRHSRRTLDVGTGCGVQAFLAAPHSDEVIGVDLNPRAVNFANFNAPLNGFPSVRFLQGDLYAPARDRRYDLIVANPPYVISPEARYLFRDSGLKGDEIAQRVIREGTPLLEEGGYLQLICEWAHLKGQPWQDRLANWVKGTGCDAWFIHFTTVESVRHAEVWLKSGAQETPEALAGRLQAWLDYHQREGIESVSDGIICLRKRSGASNWVRFDESPVRVDSCGGSVERGFAAADFLQRVRRDEDLLASKLRLAPDVTWEQKMTPTPAGWQVTQQQLFVSKGLAFRGDVDQACLALVGRCRGDRTVREVLEGLAKEAGGQSLDMTQFLPVIRGLVEQGHLLPVS